MNPDPFGFPLDFPSKSHELKNHPNVYVSISARTLWLSGPAAAVDIFRQYLQGLGTGESITVRFLVPRVWPILKDL